MGVFELSMHVLGNTRQHPGGCGGFDVHCCEKAAWNYLLNVQELNVKGWGRGSGGKLSLNLCIQKCDVLQ